MKKQSHSSKVHKIKPAFRERLDAARQKLVSPLRWYWAKKICKTMKFKKDPLAKDFKPRAITPEEAEEIIFRTYDFLRKKVRDPSKPIQSYSKLAYGVEAQYLTRDIVELVLLRFLKARNIGEIVSDQVKRKMFAESAKLLIRVESRLSDELGNPDADAVGNGAGNSLMIHDIQS